MKKEKESTALAKREEAPLTVEAELVENTDITQLSAVQSPEEALENAVRVAKVFKGVVDQKKKKCIIKGREYLEDTDWKTLGYLYGLTGKIVNAEPVEIFGQQGFKARADIIRIKDGLVVSSGESICMDGESNWKGRDLIHMKGMAQTRAISRAFRNALAWVAVLAGYAPTPAEEMHGITPGNGKKKPEGPACFECDTGVLVERTAGKGKNKGNKFWGCSNYYAKGDKQCSYVMNNPLADPKTCKHDGPTVESKAGKRCMKCGEFLKEDAPNTRSEAPGGPSDASLPIGMDEHPEAAGAATKASNLCRICGKHPERPDGSCPNEGAKPAAKSEPVKLPPCPDCKNNLLPCIAKSGHHYWGHKTGSCKGTKQMTEEEKCRVWPDRSKK